MSRRLLFLGVVLFVLPAAVLGTAELDVSEVMPDTCRLRRVGAADDEYASPTRWTFET